MLLRPSQVLSHALIAIPKIRAKYPISDEKYFARLLVCIAFQESCIAKNAAGFECFDTEAKNRKTTATGLAQVLKDTQPAIEKLMGWPKRSLDDRKDAQYALDLMAAYVAYHYHRKASAKNFLRAIASYHDGHWAGDSSQGAKYAKTVFAHYAKFNWAAIEAEAGVTVPGFAAAFFAARAEFR